MKAATARIEIPSPVVHGGGVAEATERKRPIGRIGTDQFTFISAMLKTSV
jgi:hypothetical protein